VTWRAGALVVLLGSAITLGLGERLLQLAHSIAAFSEGKSAAGPIVCSFRARTGLPCVGCGGTRAFRLGARGAFAAAARTNPLGAFAAGAVWVTMVGALASLLVGRQKVMTVSLLAVVVASPAVLMATIGWWWWRLPPGALSGP
jgi:hypothetical protein